MSPLTKSLQVLALAAALVSPMALPATAGQAESALLAKYAGQWRGTGKVTGPDPGTVVCRITFKPTSSGKLTYSGRCSYSGQGSASFRGTMFYNDAKRRYEASTSGQGGSATTVGKKQGGSIVFSARNMETRYGTASSVMTLSGSSIKMSFKLIDKDGETTASSISFSRS